MMYEERTFFIIRFKNPTFSHRHHQCQLLGRSCSPSSQQAEIKAELFYFLLQGFKKKLTLLFRIADLRIIILARSSYKCAISMAFSKVTLLWSVSWAKSTWKNVSIFLLSSARRSIFLRFNKFFGPKKKIKFVLKKLVGTPCKLPCYDCLYELEFYHLRSKSWVRLQEQQQKCWMNLPLNVDPPKSRD